jgi:hypothetical protein
LALPTLSLPASLCSCRLVSLIIISPHGRPRQLGTKFFLWVSYSAAPLALIRPLNHLVLFLLCDLTGITHILHRFVCVCVRETPHRPGSVCG